MMNRGSFEKLAKREGEKAVLSTMEVEETVLPLKMASRGNAPCRD